MKKILLILLLSFLFSHSVFANNIYKITLKDGEKTLIKFTNTTSYIKTKKLIQENIKFSCKNTSKVQFICKYTWKNSRFKGCGFVADIKAPKISFCSFKTKSKTINLEIENKIVEKKEITVFPTDYNIFSKMLKRSIQQKNLSCESSATSDIISTVLKKYITEDDIIKYLPQSYNDPISKTGYLPYFENGKRIWGDPREGFVGYIDKLPNGGKATQGGYTGYGVYEKPINNIYKRYGIKTKIVTKENYKGTQKEQLTDILKEIVKGNYVQMWGDFCTLPKYEDGTLNSYHIEQWEADKGLSGRNTCARSQEARKRIWYIKKKDGSLEKFEGLSGEHAFILLGYEGGVYNPTKIKVWDTSSGFHSFDIKEWLRKWDAMGNRSIIVYNK